MTTRYVSDDKNTRHKPSKPSTTAHLIWDLDNIDITATTPVPYLEQYVK